MAFKLNDRVKESSTTTGTGTFTLGGAVTGFETFAAGIGGSNTTYYCIFQTGTNNFEVGFGTLNGAAGTLARTSIISSSNSDAAVNFTGDTEVFCTVPGSKISLPNPEEYGSSSAPKIITVKVGTKTTAHPYSGQGSSNAYFFDGLESPAITFSGADSSYKYYYRFDQADSSNSGHPLRFYLEADKSTAYTTGVTTSGTPGSSGAYTQIAVDANTPNIVYYQCSSHAYMGNFANVISNYVNGALTVGTLLKMPDNTAAKILVADGTSYQESAVSGDATIASGGALTIANDAVTQAKIADDAVGADQLAASAVVTASIVDDNVTQAKIADDAVGADQLAANAVVTTSIVDANVTTAKVADDAITLAKMAPGTDGNLITYDASGNPAAVATGSSGQVLTSAGAGAPPTFSDAFTGLALQSVQTSNFTASASKIYPVNTTSGVLNVTLPSSPSAGDRVGVVDYAGTFDSNALQIFPNGSKIEGIVASKKLDTEREGVVLQYVDSTQGWLPVSGINEGTQALEPITYSADFLIVAGGGSGANFNFVGGGGAGGYRTSTQTVSSGTTITVTVGDGAGPGGNGQPGQRGGDSSIAGSGLSTITSTGGGGGGGNPGQTGGSGGGGGPYSPGTSVGGAGNTPSTSPSQGNPGGQGFLPPGAAGGGGGASNAGGQGSAPAGGGDGGQGTASSITGSSVTRGGGGGGGSFVVAQGEGGAGGGGDAGPRPASNGTANTGGGGGGAPYAFGQEGSGGSGIVIISVPDANYSGNVTGSPTVATGVSGKTVMQFTGSGSYIA